MNFMNIRPLYTLCLIVTVFQHITYIALSWFTFAMFASGIAMEYETWLVSGNHLENRIVEYIYIQRRIFHDAQKKPGFLSCSALLGMDGSDGIYLFKLLILVSAF